MSVRDVAILRLSAIRYARTGDRRRCEIKDKNTHFPYKLYQGRAFLLLIAEVLVCSAHGEIKDDEALRWYKVY
eukprot:2326195-Rhodomonas_salina.1